MSSATGRVWLVSGVPGAGKTTVARGICACFPAPSIDPKTLDATIRDMHPTLFTDLQGWIVVDNSVLSPREAVDRILG
jgi:adenylate kinase family enzyme